MAHIGARLMLLFVPLVAVAIHSAPSWPARAQMWEGPGRDRLLETTQAWANIVCQGTQEYWCGSTHNSGELSVDVASVEVAAMTPMIPTQDPPDMPLAMVQDASHQIVAPATEPAEVMASTMPTTSSEGDSAQAVVSAGTVLMIGDSLMNGVATGLRGQLPPQFKIIDRGRPSTGLSNREYFDWPMTAGVVVQETRPNWVIIHLGGNDGQDILYEGRWLRFGSQAWTEQYLARAELMIQQIRTHAPQAGIAWVGLPAMRPGKYADKSMKIEQLHRLAAQRQGIAYIDGRQAMGQEYQKSGPGPDGRTVILRSDDGIHYSRAGGGVLGQAVGRQLHWPLKHP